MKKIKYVVIMLLLVWFLTGCEDKTKVDDVALTKSLYAFVDEYVPIMLPEAFDALDPLQNEWTISNHNIALYEGGINVLVFATGETIIIVRNQHVTYTMHVEVISVTEVNRDIDAIIRYIRDNLNRVTDSGLDLITSVPGYDFEIDYQSLNEDVLDLNGQFTRALLDQFVILEATLNYKGIERVFLVPIKIDKIPLNEQKSQVESYINQTILTIIEEEEGALPIYYAPFNTSIHWVASYPGVVASDYQLRKALVVGEVRLYAIFRIAGEDIEMKYTYVSKGVSEEKKTEYIEEVLGDLIPSEAGRWLSLLYSKPVDIIQDIVYPNTLTRMRPGTGTNGTKMPGGPQYVVIHDTGMSGTEDNAAGLSRYIHSQANSPTGRVASWHFSIDDTEVYQHVPTDEIAWHAGDGGQPFGSTYFNTTYQKQSIGGGNQNGIGIETCINPDNDYELTLKRTAKLTASLLHQYGLDLDRIKQHYHFSGKPCPNIIRSTKGMWEAFLKDCEMELFLLKIADSVDLSWENSHPEIVRESGLITKPINDTVVDLTLNVSLDGVSHTHHYQTLVKGVSEQEKINLTYYELLLHRLPNMASGDVALPTEMPHFSTTISWLSSHEQVLSQTGVYQKPSEPTLVTLTAVIQSGNTQETKTFRVTVS